MCSLRWRLVVRSQCQTRLGMTLQTCGVEQRESSRRSQQVLASHQWPYARMQHCRRAAKGLARRVLPTAPPDSLVAAPGQAAKQEPVGWYRRSRRPYQYRSSLQCAYPCACLPKSPTPGRCVGAAGRRRFPNRCNGALPPRLRAIQSIRSFSDMPGRRHSTLPTRAGRMPE